MPNRDFSIYRHDMVEATDLRSIINRRQGNPMSLRSLAEWTAEHIREVREEQKYRYPDDSDRCCRGEGIDDPRAGLRVLGRA